MKYRVIIFYFLLKFIIIVTFSVSETQGARIHYLLICVEVFMWSRRKGREERKIKKRKQKKEKRDLVSNEMISFI